MCVCMHVRACVCVCLYLYMGEMQWTTLYVKLSLSFSAASLVLWKCEYCTFLGSCLHLHSFSLCSLLIYINNAA